MSTKFFIISFLTICLFASLFGGEKKQGDLAGSDVESKFKGTIYHAKVEKGCITLDSSTGLPIFNGVITGTQVVKNEPYQRWRFIESVETKCCILDYVLPEFLVDGKVVKLHSKTVFISPGAIITNKTLDKKTVLLASLTNGPAFELEYGVTVQIQKDGTFKIINTK